MSVLWTPEPSVLKTGSHVGFFRWSAVSSHPCVRRLTADVRLYTFIMNVCTVLYCFSKMCFILFICCCCFVPPSGVWGQWPPAGTELLQSAELLGFSQQSYRRQVTCYYWAQWRNDECDVLFTLCIMIVSWYLFISTWFVLCTCRFRCLWRQCVCATLLNPEDQVVWFSQHSHSLL